MNIERCGNRCDSFDEPSTATLAGVQLVRTALDLLGRPDVVDYVGPRGPAASRSTPTASKNTAHSAPM
jgi:hypothetical protein